MTYDVVLELSRGLSLVRAHLDMIDDITVLANNPNVARNLNLQFPSPYTREDAETCIRSCSDPKNWRCTDTASLSDNVAGGEEQLCSMNMSRVPTTSIICLNSRPIGVVSIDFASNESQYPRTGTMGYWLGEPYWGRGYATIVVKAWIDYVWRTFPWCYRIESDRYGWNVASGRVLDKAGVKLEGVQRAKLFRDGRVSDMYVYGLPRPGLEYERGLD